MPDQNGRDNGPPTQEELSILGGMDTFDTESDDLDGSDGGVDPFLELTEIRKVNQVLSKGE